MSLYNYCLQALSWLSTGQTCRTCQKVNIPDDDKCHLESLCKVYKIPFKSGQLEKDIGKSLNRAIIEPTAMANPNILVSDHLSQVHTASEQQSETDVHVVAMLRPVQ